MDELRPVPLDDLDLRGRAKNTRRERTAATSPFAVGVIVVVMASLLLVLGVACAPHQAAPDASTSVGGDDPSALDARNAAPDAPSVASAGEPSASSIGMGPVACALGLFCGVLLLLLSALRRPMPLMNPGHIRSHLIRRLLPRIVMRATAPSLTKLRVSRT